MRCLTGLLLIFGVAAVTAQLKPISKEVYVHTPLRIISSNLVDFSEIIEASLKGLSVTSCANYKIEGKIVEITGSGFHIKRSLGTRWRTEERIGPRGHVSPSGEVRIYAAPTVDFVPVSTDLYERIILVNPPAGLERKAKGFVNLFALPIADYTYIGTDGKRQTIRRFDFGQPFVGEIKSYDTLYRVSTNGIFPLKVKK